MRKSLRRSRRYILFFDPEGKAKEKFINLVSIMEKIFGTISFSETGFKKILIDDNFILIRCWKDKEDKIIISSAFLDLLFPIAITGTIKKARRVMREWRA